MNENVLDEAYSQDDSVDIQAKLVNWVAILLLWLGIVFCVVNGLWNETKVVLGAMGLIIASVATAMKYKLGVKITFIIIILGLFKIIKYFHFSAWVSLDTGVISFYFEMVMLVIGIIHFVSNRIIIRAIVKSSISSEEKQTIEKSKINGFKSYFSKKSTQELEKIASNKSLVPEANSAAKDLLESRASKEM